MSLIDFSSSSFWSDPSSSQTDSWFTESDPVGEATSSFFSPSALDLQSTVLDEMPDTATDTTSFLSLHSLGLSGGSDTKAYQNYNDFVDYRGPSRIEVVNVSTQRLGEGLEWAGDKLDKFGSSISGFPRIGAVGKGLEKVGEGLFFAGHWMAEHPVTGTYIATETMPEATGFSELRSRYIGIGLGNQLGTGGFYGQTSSLNSGGFDLDQDGHSDGAYGLVIRANTPVGRLGGSFGEKWNNLPTIAGGGQLINNLYYTPFGSGVSDTLASGGYANAPTSKPAASATTLQIGVRWPTDSVELNHLVDGYIDKATGYVDSAGKSVGEWLDRLWPDDSFDESQIYTDRMKAP